MGTFKDDLFDTCKDVAEAFPGWKFSAGEFKNKTIKHTDLVIPLGFGFVNGRTPLSPAVFIENKKTMKLFMSLIGFRQPTSILLFRELANELTRVPETFKVSAWIEQDKRGYLAALASIDKTDENASKVIDLTEARAILEMVMLDGIALIERHYDLTSEENLLNALPPKYIPRNNIPYREYEQQKGLMMCIVRVVLGDFEFVERYCSDEYKTVYPKRTGDLDKIVAALPNLKKRFAETGTVI